MHIVASIWPSVNNPANEKVMTCIFRGLAEFVLLHVIHKIRTLRTFQQQLLQLGQVLLEWHFGGDCCVIEMYTIDP